MSEQNDFPHGQQPDRPMRPAGPAQSYESRQSPELMNRDVRQAIKDAIEKFVPREEVRAMILEVVAQRWNSFGVYPNKDPTLRGAEEVIMSEMLALLRTLLKDREIFDTLRELHKDRAYLETLKALHAIHRPGEPFSFVETIESLHRRSINHAEKLMGKVGTIVAIISGIIVALSALAGLGGHIHLN